MQRDEVMPEGKWRFDAGVTAVFDDMLARSIPDYIGMRRITTELAVRFHQPLTAIVDLGCSRGTGLRPIIDQVGGACNYIGIEVSNSMRAAAEKAVPEATILDLDLREAYPRLQASVTLSILTLQFVPIEYRQRILSDAYEQTVKGGVFILAEKILGRDSFTNDLLIDTYLNRKGENGYTPEQIAAKRKSLEGVLVPVTAAWNEEMLRGAGFSHVECVWRNLNFAMWIGVKR